MTPLSSIRGVEGWIRGTATGEISDSALPDGADADTALAVTTVVAEHLAQAGSLAGLGRFGHASVRGSEATWVLTSNGDAVLAVRVGKGQPVADVERLITSGDWVDVPLREPEASTPQGVPPPHPPRPAAPSRAQAPPPPPPPQRRKPLIPKPPRPSVAAPLSPAAPPVAPSTLRAEPAPSAVPTNHSPSSLEADPCRELRRALVNGKLSNAEQIAARLEREGKSASCASSETAPTLRRLLEAVGSVLSGDNGGALAILDELRSTNAPMDASLQWASLIWSARASLASADGVRAAKGFAESALRLSTKLDVEARATSAVTVGQVSFQHGEHQRAQQWIARARQVFERTNDHQEAASALLLEAQVLAALGRDEEAARTAERARERRPSWPAPASFIACTRLTGESLDAVQKDLEEAARQHPRDADIQRTLDIVNHVAAGVVPAVTARNFLLSMHAPPGRDDLDRLITIAGTFPDVLQFSEALGWKLFQSGYHEDSLKVFEALSRKSRLPEHVRASLLLAAGYLATVELRDAKAPARLQAAVNANSTRLSAAPASSDTQASRTAFRLPSAPDASPVFVGDLQAFALPDLLEFLRAGGKTGTLVCSSGEGLGAVHLRSGRITGAVAPGSRAFREYLFEKTPVTPEQLDAVAQTQVGKEPKPLIGGLLVSGGIATVAQVRAALSEQIHDAIGELLDWKDGQFAFDPEKVVAPSESDVEIEVDPQALLLEVFRRWDEAHR